VGVLTVRHHCKFRHKCLRLSKERKRRIEHSAGIHLLVLDRHLPWNHHHNYDDYDSASGHHDHDDYDSGSGYYDDYDFAARACAGHRCVGWK